jgi:hypothetical protein
MRGIGSSWLSLLPHLRPQRRCVPHDRRGQGKITELSAHGIKAT